MIATGTDIKPLEIVMFMRSVKSRSFFEQMKGRGVRVISDTDFQSVTPDAKTKTHFVIVDAVGVCERDKTDSRPLEQKPSVPLEKLMEHIAIGAREPELLSSLAGRLIRLEKRIEPDVRAEVEKLSGGKTLSNIARDLLDAIDPDKIESSLEGRAPWRPLTSCKTAVAPNRHQSRSPKQNPRYPTRRRSNHRHRLARQTPLRRRRRENKRSRARHN